MSCFYTFLKIHTHTHICWLHTTMSRDYTYECSGNPLMLGVEPEAPTQNVQVFPPFELSLLLIFSLSLSSSNEWRVPSRIMKLQSNFLPQYSQLPDILYIDIYHISDICKHITFLVPFHSNHSSSLLVKLLIIVWQIHTKGY